MPDWLFTQQWSLSLNRRSYTSLDSGVHDTAVSPMNDKEIQTIEDTKVTAVQCSMLNVSHLQEICAEIDAQIVSVWLLILSTDEYYADGFEFLMIPFLRRVVRARLQEW